MFTKTVKSAAGPLTITIPSKASELTLGMLIALTPPPGDSLTNMEQLSILSGIPVDGDIDEPCLYDIDTNVLVEYENIVQSLAYELIALTDNDTLTPPDEVTLTVGVKHSKRFFSKDKAMAITKRVPVAKNLSIEPSGAYFEAREIMNADLTEWRQHNPDADINLWKPLHPTACSVLALYFHSKATGERFSHAKAREFESVIKQMPITEALPIARYFFLKFLNSQKARASI